MKPLDLLRSQELNDEQLAAVTHGEGPQLVIAGAGSGKTRVITYRIAWLLAERRAWPHEVVAVTFTNKAAREMRERVGKLLGTDQHETFVGTFHRYCLLLLRRYHEEVGLPRDFAILDTDDQLQAVRQALVEEKLPETSFPPRTMLAAISAAKNRRLDPERYAQTAHDFFSERVARVYSRYQQLLKRAGAVDFDDMLLRALALIEPDTELGERIRSRVRFLLVDEFQDTNAVQLDMVKALVRTRHCLTAVGDEDQGIYRWRGADLTNVLEFERHFPGTVVRKLERNYRSSGRILAAANAVISRNQLRRGKRLWTDRAVGAPLCLCLAADEADEASWVAEEIEKRLAQGEVTSEFAVLVRTNAQTRAFEEAFVRRGLPYILVGGVRFYERAEIKDLLAYLRLVLNPRDDLALRRVLNQPPRGIGPGTLERLELAARQAGTPLWDELLHGALASYPARAREALRGFRLLIEELQAAAEAPALDGFLGLVLERTGYLKMLHAAGLREAERLENLEEFVSAAGSFVSERELGAVSARAALQEFLDHVALVSDLDRWSGDRGVTLMTLHSAKGLEFSKVFVPGLEEGLLPHANSIDDGREALEEERRLFYVGLTRAMQEVFLSHAEVRRLAGRTMARMPSRFLDDLPREHLHSVVRARPLSDPSTWHAREFFRRSESRVHSPLDEEESPARAPAIRSEAGPTGSARQAWNLSDDCSWLPTRGQRVRHPELGEGVILTFEGSGSDTKVTVYFARAGRRKLLLRYARLEEA